MSTVNMQQTSNIRRDSTSSEVKNTNENNDDIQVPPPPYLSVINKLENYSFENCDDLSSLPNYSDINNPSVTYINNYPGPPLRDGTVQIITSNRISADRETTAENFLPKKMRIYLIINGAITVFFGFLTIGLQIGLLASHSIIYYYYGFWAGALIISIGVSTILFNRSYTYDLAKYFRSFICQAVFVGVVLGFGIIIMLTDTCDDTSDNENSDDACKHSYKILNGFLLTVISLTFLQSIMNILIIGILKRRY